MKCRWVARSRESNDAKKRECANLGENRSHLRGIWDAKYFSETGLSSYERNIPMIIRREFALCWLNVECEI
jgi:hypothetical protein